MKRLIIIVLLLSVGQFTIAQKLPENENLNYRLGWSLLGPEWLSIKAGEATLKCQIIKSGGYQLNFSGLSMGLAKTFYPLENYATVYINNAGLVTKIVHRFSDSKEEVWQADYPKKIIFHYLAGQLSDSLAMEHPLRDVLSLIYLLRNSRLYVGKEIQATIIGHDINKKSTWKDVKIVVKNFTELKELRRNTWCWVLKIELDYQDNIFPGGKITLWVDRNLIPIRVMTDIQLLSFLGTKAWAIKDD